MIGKPVVFISSTSDLRSARELVGKVLYSMGYEPVWQEIESTDGGELLAVLRKRLDPCALVVQLVGQRYGAEPPAPTPEFGRVSYTQFEALYAEKLSRKVIYHFIDSAFPTDPASPESDERRDLQSAYRQRIKDANKLRQSNIASSQDLELSIRRIRDELSAIRKQADRRFRRMFWLAGGTIAGVAIIVALVLVTLHRQEKAISAIESVHQLTIEDRRVTREKIRAQLMSAAEQTYQAALADADKAAEWQERQRLRDAAKKEQEVRLSRIDDLATSFAELEGTAKSTSVFDEMTRILASEGVDQALAYVDTQQSDILKKVKARAAAASETNRDELRPLLKSAELQASKGNADGAESLFGGILVLEPDWPDAVDAYSHFCIDRGDRAMTYETTTIALGHYQSAYATAQHLIALEPGNNKWQRDLSVSLERM